MRTLVALALTMLGGCSDNDNGELVGWWKFETAQARVAPDASGHENHATLRGDNPAAVFHHSELHLDGMNDNVLAIPVSASLRKTAKAITIVARVYRTADHNVALVAHGYPTLFFGFHGPQFKWQVKLDNGRSGVCYADHRHKADTGRWYHIAATYDGWSARLYVDGREICSDWTYGSISMPDDDFTIGAYVDDQGEIVDELSGRMSWVQIYSRAFSSANIQKLYERDSH